MNLPSNENEALDALSSARLVAEFALAHNVILDHQSFRAPLQHIGAILADSALQAGVNYRTVVRVRVERIIREFPEAACLNGTFHVITTVGVAEFLRWRHPAKISRFIGLANLLREEAIDSDYDLRAWLQDPRRRKKLLAIQGIGPKTSDYLCGLVGIDCIAVDRHVRTFARLAGVATADYDHLKLIISFAADLLAISRRHFDASIWTFISSGDFGQDLEQFCRQPRVEAPSVAA